MRRSKKLLSFNSPSYSVYHETVFNKRCGETGMMERVCALKLDRLGFEFYHHYLLVRDFGDMVESLCLSLLTSKLGGGRGGRG